MQGRREHHERVGSGIRVLTLARAVAPFEPLRVRGLSPVERPLVLAAVALSALWSAAFVSASLGGSLGDVWGWMGVGGWRTAAARAAGIAGIGVTAVLAVVAAPGLRRWVRRLLLLVVALPLYQVAEGSAYVTSVDQVVPAWAQVARSVGVVAALALIAVPLGTRPSRTAAVALAVVAAVQPLVTLALLGELSQPWIGMVHLRADPLWRLMDSLSALLVLYLFWGLIEWARLLSGWAERAGHVADAVAWVLPAAVVVKLAWSAAGLTGALPALLGGASDAWSAAAGDGWASWLTAAGLVAAGAYWILRAPTVRAGTDEEGEVPSTAHLLAVSALLAAPALVASLLQMVPGIVRLVVRVPPNAFTGHFLLAPLVVVVASAWVCWREAGKPVPNRSWQLTAAAFFAVLAAVVVFHVAPRLGQLPFPFDRGTVGNAGDTLFDPAMGDEQYVDAAPGWERAWSGAGGTFEPATLDTLVTLAVAVLSVVALRRGRPRRGVLVAVLVASSVYAHSATLAPTGWVGQSAFYLAFVFPVAMELLIDARELNEPGPGRGRRVVVSLAFIVLLLTIAGWRLLAGLLDASTSLADEAFAFTRGIELRFLLAAIVAAVVGGAIERLVVHAPGGASSTSEQRVS